MLIGIAVVGGDVVAIVGVGVGIANRGVVAVVSVVVVGGVAW